MIFFYYSAAPSPSQSTLAVRVMILRRCVLVLQYTALKADEQMDIESWLVCIEVRAESRDGCSRSNSSILMVLNRKVCVHFQGTTGIFRSKV